MITTEKKKSYISGLDTLRFVAAMVVVLGHLSIPFPDFGNWGRPLEILWNNLFNGPAAVIVFFVLSGFVIHLPQVNRGVSRVEVQSFYLRRFIRIGLPSVAALVLFAATNTAIPGVLWSVICEAIYYALYPFLLMVSEKIEWKRMIVATTFFALGLALTNSHLLTEFNNGYIAFGYATWIIGLPMWLLGCWLAEHQSRFSSPTLSKLNSIRAGIFALSVVLRMVKFHVPEPWGSNVFWLNLFGFAATYWLGNEIAYRRTHPAAPFLDRLGVWSFSLYLTHSAVFVLIKHTGIEKTTVTSLFSLLAALLFAYVFYLVVERPSHDAARHFGARVIPKKI